VVDVSLRKMGVRFNDFGTFGRANRFVRKENEGLAGKAIEVN